MTYRYPVLLDLSDCLAVIVGGGGVGVRKAAGLIEGGVRQVRVISPEFHVDLPAGVERVSGVYRSGHLEGARLAFAATDSAVVNAEVVRDAKRMGIWVNRADGDEEMAGDFVVPALWREGEGMVVAVSAGGSPALGVKIRDGLRERVDPRWGKLAGMLQEMRPRIRAGLTGDRRRALLRELASEEALEIAGSGDAQSLWRWAAGRYPELGQP